MPMKVRMVEDNPEIRDTLVEALQEEGCQVQDVSDGEAALQVLEAEGGWVVFLDWMMLGLDGRAVLQAVQTRSQLRETNQFILMSAIARWRLEDTQRAAGVCTDFLPKPFELEEVLDLLQRLGPSSPPTLPPAEPA